MKNAGAFSENHLNLGIKTYLNGTLTSTSSLVRVKSQPTPHTNQNGLTALSGRLVRRPDLQ
jgi:hypothetical protein